MLNEFVRRALPYTESSRDLSSTDWLAIAQHHGMPTRLLDWTGSALAALWFAVEKSAEGDVPGAVWMLTYEMDDFLTADDDKAPFDRASAGKAESRTEQRTSRRHCAQSQIST